MTALDYLCRNHSYKNVKYYEMKRFECAGNEDLKNINRRKKTMFWQGKSISSVSEQNINILF
jgi:hypothetical protein